MYEAVVTLNDNQLVRYFAPYEATSREDAMKAAVLKLKAEGMTDGEVRACKFWLRKIE